MVGRPISRSPGLSPVIALDRESPAAGRKDDEIDETFDDVGGDEFADEDVFLLSVFPIILSIEKPDFGGEVEVKTGLGVETALCGDGAPKLLPKWLEIAESRSDPENPSAKAGVNAGLVLISPPWGKKGRCDVMRGEIYGYGTPVPGIAWE